MGVLVNGELSFFPPPLDKSTESTFLFFFLPPPPPPPAPPPVVAGVPVDLLVAGGVGTMPERFVPGPPGVGVLPSVRGVEPAREEVRL